MVVPSLAQLEVLSDGTVYVRSDSLFGRTNLSVGGRMAGMCPLDYAYYFTGLRSFAYNPAHTGHTIGVFGESCLFNPSPYYSSIGVWGLGGGAAAGRNIGVAATLHNNAGGAGLYAADQDNAFFPISGNYAGYFYGATHVEGAVTSSAGFYSVSDTRLRHSVVPLSIQEHTIGSTLDNIMGLEVLDYKLHSATSDAMVSLPESMRPKGKDPNPDIHHIGLSAEELQKKYPDLVREGQDGYLYVNYTELVPVLVRAIQEQKEELDAVKGTDEKTERGSRTATAVSASAASGANVLYQNTPNPFKEQTTIRFTLADDAHDASVCIFDMTGARC